ncbi:MAG: DUF2199 domain-containing protein [Ahniella sp.]|nr:DUF2199 domain-containing protein [Ahniella sp.]
MPFLCTSCGKKHDSLPEPAYQRPDDVWALSADERALRVTGGNDLCSLAGEGPRTGQVLHSRHRSIGGSRNRRSLVRWGLG